MILVSSFRAFADDPDGSYRTNQLAAFRSWQKVATKIVFFNGFEPELDSPKTIFIPSERYPQILQLVEFCAAQTEWCALLNADIVLGAHFPLVEAKLKARHAQCASSWRYNFDPAVGIQSGVHDDNGLDFFAAVPSVWQKAYEMCDERLTISSGGWDQWCLSLFCTFFQQGFWNVTPSRVIFHPNAAAHGPRIHGPRAEIDTIQTYGWPQMASASIT